MDVKISFTENRLNAMGHTSFVTIRQERALTKVRVALLFPCAHRNPNVPPFSPTLSTPIAGMQMSVPVPSRSQVGRLVIPCLRRLTGSPVSTGSPKALEHQSKTAPDGPYQPYSIPPPSAPLTMMNAFTR